MQRNRNKFIWPILATAIITVAGWFITFNNEAHTEIRQTIEAKLESSYFYLTEKRTQKSLDKIEKKQDKLLELFTRYIIK